MKVSVYCFSRSAATTSRYDDISLYSFVCGSFEFDSAQLDTTDRVSARQKRLCRQYSLLAAMGNGDDRD